MDAWGGWTGGWLAAPPPADRYITQQRSAQVGEWTCPMRRKNWTRITAVGEWASSVRHETWTRITQWVSGHRVVVWDAYLIEESCEASVDELQRVHHISHPPSWCRVPGMPSLHLLPRLSPFPFLSHLPCLSPLPRLSLLPRLSPLPRLLPILPLPGLARRSALLAPLLLLDLGRCSWGRLLLHNHRPPPKHWRLGGRCRVLGLAHFRGGPPPDTLVRLVGHFVGHFVGQFIRYGGGGG